MRLKHIVHPLNPTPIKRALYVLHQYTHVPSIAHQPGTISPRRNSWVCFSKNEPRLAKKKKSCASCNDPLLSVVTRCQRRARRQRRQVLIQDPNTSSPVSWLVSVHSFYLNRTYYSIVLCIYFFSFMLDSLVCYTHHPTVWGGLLSCIFTFILPHYMSGKSVTYGSNPASRTLWAQKSTKSAHLTLTIYLTYLII